MTTFLWLSAPRINMIDLYIIYSNDMDIDAIYAVAIFCVTLFALMILKYSHFARCHYACIRLFIYYTIWAACFSASFRPQKERADAPFLLDDARALSIFHSTLMSIYIDLIDVGDLSVRIYIAADDADASISLPYWSKLVAFTAWSLPDRFDFGTCHYMERGDYERLSQLIRLMRHYCRRGPHHRNIIMPAAMHFICLLFPLMYGLI